MAKIVDSTNQNEKLLDQTKAEDSESSLWIEFGKLWSIARWTILNAFLHPIYSITNAIVLGHQSDEKLLAGLGLGSLTIGICALSIGSNCNQAVGTFISNAHG